MSTHESHTQPITCCSAGRGWLWWVEAFRMLKEAFGAWYLIGLGYLAILIVMQILVIALMAAGVWLGVIGNLLVYAIMPCLIVGFVAAGWTQVRGGKPKFSHLFSGFTADVKTLMGVGVATAALIGFSVLISFFFLGSDFLAEIKNFAQVTPATADDPATAAAAQAFLNLLTSPRLWLAMFVFAILLTLALMAVWLAPMVVAFQRTGVIAAIRSSFMGSLINWRALSIWFLVPMVGSFAIGIVLSVLIMVPMLILLAIGGESAMAAMPFLIWGVELLTMPIFLSLTILTAFVAYCDIFHAKDAVFPRPAKAPKAP